MDEPLSAPRRTWPLIALLLLAALAPRVYQVKTSAVAARDSVGYVRMAWRLEHGDWRQVLPDSPHHPGYPLSILAASSVVRMIHPGPLPDVMLDSAQLASALAGVLLVVPMFYLGCELFEPRVGFWAALLFQCLPASGRVLGDGLSEALFLLCAVMALWLAAVAFNRRSPWCFAGVGLCGALAYLTRPEGALLVAATGVVLAAVQLGRGTRRPWGNWAASALGLASAALLVAGPFMILIDGFSTKTTAKALIKEAAEPTDGAVPSGGRPGPAISGVAREVAVLAVWFDPPASPPSFPEDRRVWGLFAVGDVLSKLFFYVLWLPALLGLWVRRERFRLFAGIWVLVVLPILLLPLLYRVAVAMGYLSDRHALLILCCAIYPITTGLFWLGERAAWCCRSWRWATPSVCAASLVAVACAAGLVRTLEPLERERAGYREAGYWLAEHAQPGDVIDDPYTWASYYAGRDFIEESPSGAPATPRCVYVVLERSGTKPPHLLPRTKMADVVAKGALLKTWPVRRSREKAEVVLYKMTF